MSDTIWKKMKGFVFGGEYEEEETETEQVKSEEIIEEEESVDTEDRNIITDTFVRPTRANLVDLSNPNHLKVIVYKPTKYSDAEDIVMNLKSKKPVVVNLEDVEVELARKIFNFCSGAICALDGEMRKISKEIFILAPTNVSLDSQRTMEEEAEQPFDWRK